jgi:uncharacterized protein involved in exopolysaccharide biosynthesis
MGTDDLTLATLATGILERWRQAAGVALVVVGVALLLSFVLPARYQSQSTFVVATDNGVKLPKGLADLAAQPGLSGLASQLNLGSGSDPSTSPAFYAQLLASRELLTRLVLSHFPNAPSAAPADSADLLEIYRIREKDHQRGIEIAIKQVKRDMKVTFDARTSLVSVAVNARRPEVSAAVANRAVELVSAFNREQRLSRERARRIFLDARVSEAAAELREAEVALRTFYEKNRQWQNSPALVIDERRVRRQVEMASDLYLSIRREFEAARIDEVNNTPVVTVVDEAVPPRKPLWPRYLLILVSAGVLGAGLGVLWASARVVASHWAGQHPADAAGLRSAALRARREMGNTFRRGRPAGRPPSPTA